MLEDQVFKLLFLEDMVVSFVYYGFLLFIDLAALVVYVLEITLVFKG